MISGVKPDFQWFLLRFPVIFEQAYEISKGIGPLEEDRPNNKGYQRATTNLLFELKIYSLHYSESFRCEYMYTYSSLGSSYVAS